MKRHEKWKALLEPVATDTALLRTLLYGVGKAIIELENSELPNKAKLIRLNALWCILEELIIQDTKRAEKQ